MSIFLGNQLLSDIVKPEYLTQIKNYLDTNGYQRVNTCDDVKKQEGNYHIFEIPPAINMCGISKVNAFIEFLQDNDMAAEAFKNPVQLNVVEEGETK